MSDSLHIADVLRQHLPAYQASHMLDYQQQKVCNHILSCRTEKLGQQLWSCDSCGYQQIQYCSCRDRHCPRCQGQASEAWCAKQQADLIDTQYFHLVFTLPHELNVISQYNPEALYNALFEAVWQTLSQFAIKRKQLQGQLGMTAVLHTWGQTLAQHIHLHCLIPGGVLTQTQQWHGVKTDYLFPVKALSTVFRGKMFSALRNRGIQIPGSEHLMAKPWCVFSKACLSRPETVINYLARYTRRGMLHESRLKQLDHNSVSFSYKDYQDGNKIKLMILQGGEFIRRYLTHVLPKGFMRIRHYGFLANACRKKKLAHIKCQCGKKESSRATEDKKRIAPVLTCHWPCPICKAGKLVLSALCLMTEQIKRERTI